MGRDFQQIRVKLKVKKGIIQTFPETRKSKNWVEKRGKKHSYYCWIIW